MKIYCLLLTISLSGTSLLAQEIKNVSGHTTITKTPEGVEQLKIRTPKEDILVDLLKLSPQTQQKLRESTPNTKQTVPVAKDAILSTTPAPMGIRADCSEIPTDMKELENIATKSKDMVDFLKKIPEGSLQGFTFVTNSLSLHRGKKDKNGEGQVSAMWPRVLRTSMDGKTTVSFVCDPKNPTFGKVEIIHFDDKEKEFKTTEFDFGHPSSKNKVAPKDRVHHDPVSCISCHAGSDFNGKTSLKPNWPEYFQWSDCEEDRGISFYGGNDDSMGKDVYRPRDIYKENCTTEKHKKFTSNEQNNFLKFREKQANNECFNTLPWPKPAADEKSDESKWSYKYYPYATSGQDIKIDPKTNKVYQNYSLRTNLRLTDTYSHLMAQRIGNLLKKSPDYDAVKYLLVLESAQCKIEPADLDRVNAVISGSKLEGNQKSSSSLENQTPLLASFAKHAGLSERDWTMEFREQKKADYTSAMFNQGAIGGDLTINLAVGGQVLEDLHKSNPDLKSKTKDQITRGTEKSFTEKFSCIDDLGGALKSTDYTTGPTGKDFCKTIKDLHDQNIAKIEQIQKDCVDCKKVELPKVEKVLAETVDEVVKKFSSEQIARGKKLIEADSKGKCVMCHSSSVDMLPKDFRFIPGDKDPKKAESIALIRARKNEIAGKIENRLIKTKTMPPPPLGAELSDKDREDVKAYLLSVAAGDK